MTTRKATIVSVVIAALLSQSAVGQQQVFNINFTSGNGANPDVVADGTAWSNKVAPYDYGNGNTFWNDWSAGGDTPLLEFLTDATGSTAEEDMIDFSFDATDATGVKSFSQLPPDGGLTPVVDNYAYTTDNWAAPPEEAFWKIAFMEPGSTWDLFFISQGDKFGQGGAFRLFEVDGNGDPVMVEGERVPISDTLESTGTTPQAANLLSADFDADNDVDGADFLTWQRGYGLTGQTDNSNGDANLDEVVDALDLTEELLEQFGDVVEPVEFIESQNYVVFRDVVVGEAGVVLGGWDDNAENPTFFAIVNGAQFVKKSGATAAAISGVPEPSSIVSLLLGGTLLLGLKFRRQRR